MFTQLMAIAAGGAAGALARFGISNGVHALLGRGFPYGTLVVNVTGSLIMGLLYALLVERLNVAPEWRAALMIGFLGSLTTFSTFSMETVALMEDNQWTRAIINVGVSVLLCLLVTWLGVIMGRRL